MAVDYGRNVFPRGSGIPIMLSYDGKPEWKPGSLSIDWATVAAVGSDTTLTPEGLIIPSGTKYLRYGQFLTRITTAGAFTITVTGTPAGGSFTLAIYNPLTLGTTTITVPYNAAVAAVQTLVDTALGAGNSVVSGAGAFPGNVQTVTAAGALLGYTLTAPVANASGLTGGTTPAVATAVTVAGTSTGKYGPYDPAASDGRQTMTRSACALLNETLMEGGVAATIQPLNTVHPGAIIGGRVWKDRLIATTGTHTLAAGPTFTELEAALPRLIYATN